ncbi:hypothetical protein [Rhodococcus sp. GOMB7]|uniref:hypothetical protein n=1 Tax=Rhodococcus sp. GOMB7 TaxID=2839033 RepID=UPI0020786545|nr:hypothetical protein [Rhodococcus sp. GOMB7]
MAHLSALEPDQDQTQPVVELRIQATLDQLSILRALAATVAIQENFDLDAIADIKLAMDEICTHRAMIRTCGWFSARRREWAHLPGNDLKFHQL